MAETSKKVYYPVLGRKIVPKIPADSEHLKELEEDLITLGCRGVLHKPWGIKSDVVLLELSDDTPNQYDQTIRGHPEVWKEED